MTKHPRKKSQLTFSQMVGPVRDGVGLRIQVWNVLVWEPVAIVPEGRPEMAETRWVLSLGDCRIAVKQRARITIT
jgi:hypothetical protein